MAEIEFKKMKGREAFTLNCNDSKAEKILEFAIKLKLNEVRL